MNINSFVFTQDTQEILRNGEKINPTIINIYI